MAIVATAPLIEKYGIDEILKPFLDDLITLESIGIPIKIKSEVKVFRGALLLFLADNLASHALGGFKESFSFAIRICLTCNATKDNYKTTFRSKQFELRTMDQHKSQCSLLFGPAQSHFSKVYGINHHSCLLDLSSFSMIGGGLPHDAMHDILEGIAPREVALLLQHCIIEESYFTLEKYNKCLLNFDYNYTETDKPSLILSRSVLMCREWR